MRKNLDNLIRPVVNAMGYELWGFEVHQSGRHSLLRVYIDVLADDVGEVERKKSVSIDDCAKVSNQISALLDVEDPIKSQYTLEVSSPGLNRIIFTHNQFKKFVGSPLNVTLIHPELGRKIFIGFLRKVGDDNISIEVEGGILEIATENIRKAMVLDHHYIKERPAL